MMTEEIRKIEIENNGDGMADVWFRVDRARLSVR